MATATWVAATTEAQADESIHRIEYRVFRAVLCTNSDLRGGGQRPARRNLRMDILVVAIYSDNPDPTPMNSLTVTYRDGTRELDVVEFIGYEPGNYAWEDGYICEDTNGIEYFVSLTGRVDLHTDDEGWIMGWGTCPKLENEYNLLIAVEEAMLPPDHRM